MARKRMVDPGIWQSQDYGNLSVLAKLIFIGLFSQADDHGYGRANPQFIKSVLFPYDDQITKKDIEKSLSEIASHMSILFYRSDGNEYYHLTNWLTWQKVDRPQPSKLPTPEYGSAMYREQFDDTSPNVLRTVPDDKAEQTGRYSKHFEGFWDIYPRKEGKADAYGKYQARVKDGYSAEELITAARAYADRCSREKVELKYIKLAKTFLGPSTPFVDFLNKEVIVGGTHTSGTPGRIPGGRNALDDFDDDGNYIGSGASGVEQ